MSNLALLLSAPVNKSGKGGSSKPANAPSTTANPSGGSRGNNPSRK